MNNHVEWSTLVESDMLGGHDTVRGGIPLQPRPRPAARLDAMSVGIHR